MKRVVALILAGGQGDRLSVLSEERAKPAVYFGGPYRIIDFSLSNCINSGLRRIFIATQYKSLSLNRHIRMGWSIVSEELGEFVEILPPQKRVGEHWYQGTADAVYQNLYSIIRENPRYVVVLAGDHVYKMDYNVLFAEHSGERSASQIRAFEDTWRWDLGAEAAYQMAVERGGRVSDAMRASFEKQGEALLGGDVTMARPHRSANPTERAWMAERGTVSGTATLRAMARRLDATVGGVVDGKPHPLSERIEERDLERGALARLRTRQEGREHTAIGVHTGRNVGDRDPDLRRRLRGTGDGEQTRLALHEQVVRLPIGIRTVGAVARHLTDDEAWIGLSEGGGAEAQSIHRTRREIVDEHVAPGEQPPEDLLPLWPLHVERQRLLRPIQPHEVARHTVHRRIVAAREVARAGPFDLDDPCTQVGELTGGERCGDGLLERDHGRSLQR